MNLRRTDNRYDLHQTTWFSWITDRITLKTVSIAATFSGIALLTGVAVGRSNSTQKNNVDESKKYVGIYNEGATCYMNTLIQTLFHLPEFKRRIFASRSSSGIIYAFQKLFYNMQFNNGATASTANLMDAFGWGNTDANIQQDIQELTRLLLEVLENVNPQLTALFEGQTRSYIECTKVDFKSSRIEMFHDLQLDVSRSKNVLQSFVNYTSPELLYGPNQYNTDDQRYGRQDALKGVRFVTLPPVLMLHLERYTFNPYTQARTKINTPYDVELKINLSRFVEDSDNNDVYCLHSVLVHKGNVNSGHYYNYVRTSLGVSDADVWHKFNDDTVSEVGEYEVLSSKAYMLCYVRESEIPNVMCKFQKSEISPQLVERIERDSGMCVIL
ncbi:ubiquitin carboxyl-terminal hydrolase [Acrasis kona]|uniref:Ubiquitin carboxyl-terminal hydrolase n=1 Tax=Acrasis kona TaxID=1008807 RepID=A0AAW2Z190_9EUKA